MATFLLTWNPDRFHWDTIDDEIDEIEHYGSTEFNWSCGNTQRIAVGDRVFMLRQGGEPRGIIGSGWVTEEPMQDEHWEDQSGREVSPDVWYIQVEWDYLTETPLIARSELDAAPLNQMNWTIQRSGVGVPEAVARTLERLWGQRTGSHLEPLAEEVDDSEYSEGAIQIITVNAYERNPHARKACIDHYGAKCSVCQLEFGKTYGPDAEGLIHVHHLRSLAEIGEEYNVDPISDLRPVCPNCHAVIHRRVPSYSIQEVRAMLKLK